MCRGLFCFLISEIVFWGFSSSLWYSDMYRYFIGVRTGCACVRVIPPHLWRYFPLYSSVLHNDERFSLLQNPYLFTGSRDRRCVWVNFGLMLNWWVFVCVTYLWSGCILCFRNITAFLSTMKVRRLKLKSTSYLCPLWFVGFRQLPSAFRIVLVSIPSIYS